MEFEQVVEVVNTVIAPKIARTLTEVEVALLFGAWNNLTYDRIAERSGYSINYLQRDVGPKFWKLLSDALGRKVNKTNLRGIITHFNAPTATPQPQVQRSIDWGEAINVSNFQGRGEEIETLTRWIIQDRCRLIALVGMGGIGKSTLAAKVAQLLQEQFQFVIWRSLRNAPRLETLLSELVPFLSNQQDLQAKPERLLYWLQTHRCLVILDNQETILQAGNVAGYYQPDFTDYDELLQLLGEASHQSCILLTSREKSAKVAISEDLNGAVRSLCLSGSWETSLALMDSKKLIGTDTEKRRLCELYCCNPLALKIVAASIQSLFEGNISYFLQEKIIVFNGISILLNSQFERLSPVEQTIMYWLAINREWTTIAELQDDIVPPISRATLLESLESLTRRSLIEKRSGEYTLQPVVMEYVTDSLIQHLVTELLTVKFSYFHRYALIKTTVLDYIQDTQVRLILQPLIQKLQDSLYNSDTLEQHLQSILTALRHASTPFFDYGVGNLINLCRHLQIDLTGWDFSHLKIRHADFRGATLQDINFQSAHFAQSLFTQLFTGGAWVKFSPDGRRFAIGDTNGGLHIWQFKPMQLLMTIQAGRGWIKAGDWSIDGTMIVCCAEHRILVWDTRTGQCLREFQGYTKWIFALALSPDGQKLACGGQDPLMWVWDAATGTCLTRLGSSKLTNQSCWVLDVEWLANGTILAGAYTDHTIKLWDVTTGDCIRVIPAHEYWVWSLALHPNGKVLASSGYDQTVKLWDWQTGECLQATTTQDCIYRVEWSPDGHRLAGGSLAQILPLWDSSLNCLHVFQGEQSWVWAIDWSRDGSTLVSASFDQVIKFWNSETGECFKTLQGYSNSCWYVRWSQDGVRLLSSNTNYTVQLWDSQTGECLRVFQGHTKEVLSVAWSPDERLIVSGSADATVRIWEVQTGRCLKVLSGHENWVRSVAWSRDGNSVISGSNDQTVRIWDAHSGECLLTLSDHQNQVISVVGFPVGNRVASGSADRTIRLWDLSQGVCERVIETNHLIHSIALSPDGKTLVSGDYDGNVQLWDVASGACLRILQSHRGHIYSVAWNVDGNLVASASSDATVRIWDVRTGKCEQVIEGKNYAWSVDWNPVKPLLAIAFLEQPIQLWDIQTYKLTQTFKSILPYEGMNITGVTGMDEGQKATLKALGAIQEGVEMRNAGIAKKLSR
ncbi:NB-ARC domain-containing protein [Planktothrix sp. FACHB-1365]|uniref:WD40 domain-containing protein n=1 Tax=Planktothrix sp. FACHB-1365 TaxID=2692855 RepID=UPI00168358C6|nr:NB-ARC domain-containing protein [Planktothrix sp. FACHB-1365]MBD2485847.1 NACHT domain-containing protein [Planktothrix sp. FACHB-1365]